MLTHSNTHIQMYVYVRTLVQIMVRTKLNAGNLNIYNNYMNSKERERDKTVERNTKCVQRRKHHFMNEGIKSNEN